MSTEGPKKDKFYNIDSSVVYNSLLNDDGHAAYCRLARGINLNPVTRQQFYEHARGIYKMMKEFSDDKMIETRRRVKLLYKDTLGIFPDSDGYVSITVSLDGSYTKRGFKSNFCISFICESLSGYVLDYHITEKCTKCENKDQADTECEYDLFHGFSGTMEKINAQVLFNRSQELGFQYDTLVADGDSSSHDLVKDTYGPDSVVKEECFVHVTRRMWKRMEKFCNKFCYESQQKKDPTKKNKNYPLRRKQYNDFPLKFSGLYRLEVKKNIPHGAKKMSDAVNGIFWHHCDFAFATAADREKFHKFCTVEFCPYLQHKNSGTDRPYVPQKPGRFGNFIGVWAKDARVGIQEIFEDLGHEELMGRSMRMLTQNANESLHGKVFSRCSKNFKHKMDRIDFSCMSTMLEHNHGKDAGSIQDLLMPPTKAGKRTTKAEADNCLRSAKQKSKKRKTVDQPEDAGADYVGGGH